MASGTVKYTFQIPANNNEEVYNGVSAKHWRCSSSGSFPAKYTVTSATIQFDARTVYAPDRHMVVSRLDGGSATPLGDVPTGTKGPQTQSLNTGANYEGITAIQLDGVERWACQLRAGSSVTLVIQWTDEEPEEDEQAEDSEDALDVVTGTIRKDGGSDLPMTTRALIAFEGADISDDIAGYLLSFSCLDNEEDETDDLQLSLQDRDGSWLKKWLDASLQATISYGSITLGGKTKGLRIQAGIRCSYPGGTVRQTDFGSFILDSFTASGPPSTVTIKASSLPWAEGVRTEERDKAWEEYHLSGIGGEIAGKAGLGFLYDCDSDPFYKRLEQTKTTDIAFLKQLCHDAGFSLKVSDCRLIIFDQAKYEALAAVLTISWMDGTYTKYTLSTTESDVTYAQCQVRYYDPDKKETIIGTANADTFDAEDKNNQTLVITDHKVTSVGEASALAEKLLRLHNKFEREATFTLVGNPLLAAGLNVNLSGFGLWDGKYFIRKCKHDISASGYTTQVTLRAIYAHSTEATKKEEKKQQGGSSAEKKQDQDTYWGLAYTASVFSAPPGTPGSSSLGTQPAGTAVTILGSTSGAYTLVSAGGQQGYVSTGALKKIPK